jgi:hypothetical protein
MQLFNLGESVIDTKTHECASVVAVIPAGENSISDLYVLLTDYSDYYITDGDRLVVYDKYYWDDLPATVRALKVLEVANEARRS